MPADRLAVERRAQEYEPRKQRVPAMSGRRTARDSAVVRDPHDADYNSVELNRLTAATASDIYEAEPRREEWAGEFESMLTDYVSDSIGGIFPNVSVSAECRSASCRVRYGVEGMDGTEWEMFQSYVQIFVPLGPIMSVTHALSEDGNPIYVNTALLPPEMLDLASFNEFTRRVRGFQAEKESEAKRMIRALRVMERESDEG